MSWLSALFSNSDKAVSTGLDLASRAADGIDAIFYTDEEKAATSIERMKLKLKVADGVRKFVETTQSENSMRSVTRRIIAWVVIGLNVLLTAYYVIVCTAAVLWTSKAEKMTWLANRILDALEYWGAATVAIVTFYFGYYAISNVVGKWRETKAPPSEPVFNMLKNPEHKDKKEEVDNV